MSRIVQKLMSLGSWSLNFDRLPAAILDALIDNPWGEIYVTTARVPKGFQDKTSLQSLSVFTGVLWEVSKDEDEDADTGQGIITIEGPSNAVWLGDPSKNRGAIIETNQEFTSATVATVVAALLPVSVTSGAISSPAGYSNYDGAHFMETPNQALTAFASYAGGEWRINPDGTFDFGDESQLGYVTTPTAYVMPKIFPGIGVGGDAGSFHAPTSLNTLIDITDYATVGLLAGQGGGHTIVLGSANVSPSTPYSDPNGNDLIWKRIFNEPVATITVADARAQALLDDVTNIRQEISLSLERYVAGGSYALGDTIYVYAPPLLSDNTVAAEFGGMLIQPVATRVLGITWSVLPTMGVYFRDHSDNIYDLSPFFNGSDSPPSLEVGSLKRSIFDTSNGAGIIQARLTDSDQDTTVPNVPGSIVYAADGVYQHRGSERAKVKVSWVSPTTNTNATSITDASHILIGYKRTADSDWDYTQAPWTDTDLIVDRLLIDRAYHFRIRAVDLHGNTSDWDVDAGTSVTTGTDISPPSQPASPTITGMGSASIRVAHDLTKEGGGALEDDTKDLRVYIHTSDPVTIADTNLAGMISADFERIAGGKKVREVFDSFGDANTPLVRGTTYFVAVTAVDRSDNPSTESVEVSTVAGDFVAPGVPTDAAVVDNGIYQDAQGMDRGSLRFSWTKPTASDLSHCSVRHRRINTANWGTTHVVDPDDTQELVVDDLAVGKTREFQVRGVDVHGNKSAWTTEVQATPGADTTAPGTPAVPTFRGSGSNSVTVIHGLQLAAGGDLPIDTRALRVYLGDTANFTPGATTFAGVIHVTTADIAATLDVRRRFSSRNKTTPADLIRGTTYYAKVVAVDGAKNASAASADPTGVVAGDFNAPGVPGGLALTAQTAYQTTSGQTRASLLATWNAVAAVDVDRYVVQLKRNSESQWGNTVRVQADDTLEAKFDDLSVGITYDSRVRAIDVHGNKSAWSSTVSRLTTDDLTAPNTPSVPKLRGSGSNSITVIHDLKDNVAANLAADTRALRVYISTSTPFTPAAATFAGIIPIQASDIGVSTVEVRQRFSSHNKTTPADLIRGTTYYVRVIAVDAAKNISTASAEASNDVVAGDYTAPGLPTSLSVVDGGVSVVNGKMVGSLNVQFIAPTAADLSHYLLRYRRTGRTKWAQTLRREVGEEDADIDNLRRVSYDVEVRSVDGHGNKSAWTATKTGTPGSDATVPTTFPGAGLSVTKTTGGIRIGVNLGQDGWGAANLDVDRIVFFGGTGTSPTTNIGAREVTYRELLDGETVYKNFAIPQAELLGLWYVRVKARDEAHNLSSSYSTTVSTSGNQIVEAGIADLAISTAKLVDSAVSTVKIADLGVTLAKYATKSIKAVKLSLPDFNFLNMALNPNFDAGVNDPVVDPHSYTTGGGTWSTYTAAPHSGTNAARFDVDSQSATAAINVNGGTNAQPPAEQGDVWVGHVWARRVNVAATNSSIRVRFLNAALASIQETVLSITGLTTSWQEFVVISAAAPADTAFVQLRLIILTGGGATEDVVFDSLKLTRAVASDHIVAGAVTAGKILADTIDANHISALAVSAKHLQLQGINLAQMLKNPNFETDVINGALDPHTYTAAGGTWASSSTKLIGTRSARYDVDSQSSTMFLQYNGSATLPQFHAQCTPGDVFWARIWSRYIDTANTVNPILNIRFHDSAGATLATKTVTMTSLTTTFKEYEVLSDPAPASTSYVTCFVSMVSGNAATVALLFDGGWMAQAIQTRAIVANAITADKMSVSQLSAITADMGSITAGTITAGTIRTAASGQRIQILNSVIDTISFYTGDAQESSPGFISTKSGWGGAGGPGLILESPDNTSYGTDRAYLHLEAGSSPTSRPTAHLGSDRDVKLTVGTTASDQWELEMSAIDVNDRFRIKRWDGAAVNSVASFSLTGMDLHENDINNVGILNVNSAITSDNDRVVDIGTNAVRFSAIYSNWQNIADWDSAGTILVLESHVDNLNDAELTFRKARGAVEAPTAVQSGDNIGSITFEGYGASGFGVGVKISTTTRGADPATHDSDLLIQTRDTIGSLRNRFFIDGSADVSIYDASGTLKWQFDSVQAKADSNATLDLRDGYLTGNDAEAAVAIFRDDATTTVDVLTVRSDVGGANTVNARCAADGDWLNTNGSYGTISDERLKNEWKNRRVGYLTEFMKLDIGNYKLEGRDQKLMGAKAQEVAKIWPALIKPTEDTLDGEPVLAVKTSVLYGPIMASAFQEAVGEIEGLRKRVEQLERTR